MTGKRMFKKGDIVELVGSNHQEIPWVVIGYTVRHTSTGKVTMVHIRRISLPSCPLPEVEGLAEESWLIRRNPIRHTSSGWHWGSRGPFPTREKALSVMRAAYARGYRGSNPTLFDTPIMGARVSTPSGRTGTVQSVRGDKVKVKWGKASVWYPKAQFLMVRSGRNPLFGSDAENLYQSFHEASPVRQRKVFYEPPKGQLVKIGRLARIEYDPEPPSKLAGSRYTHEAGDLGHKVIKSNALLASNEDGTQLYIVKEKKSPYPKFSNRGVIG